MSFTTALSLTLVAALFILACTMANLLARITRLERFAQQVAGLALPAPSAPVPVPEALAALTQGHEAARVVFLSPDCPACDEAIALVGESPEEVRRSTFLLYREEPAPDFVAPPGVRMVPQAAAAFDSLAIGSTPVFVHVHDGLVAGRTTGLPSQTVGPVPESVDAARK